MRSQVPPGFAENLDAESQYEFVPGFFCFTVCFVTTVSRHGSQRSRIITISIWASVLFCLFTFRFLLLKRALEPADWTPSALLRTTPPWDRIATEVVVWHQECTGPTAIYLRVQ